jgi:hypothetical protein
MTLVEFLQARLAEDELIAGAAIERAADWGSPTTLSQRSYGHRKPILLREESPPAAVPETSPKASVAGSSYEKGLARDP